MRQSSRRAHRDVQEHAKRKLISALLNTMLASAVAMTVTAAAVAVALTPIVFQPSAPAFAAEDTACAPGVMARIPGPPPIFEEIGLTPASLRYTGAGVLVAIVDSGVDITRPQLASAFAPGSTSLVTDGERPDGLGDPQGHGTAIAGIIAARPETGSGVVGVAPGASIVSVRVFRGDDDESKKKGLGPESGRLAAGIRLSADLGAKIIVVALSDDIDSTELRQAAEHAHQKGALIVASAGNRGTTSNKEDSPRYPAAYPGALAVTALNGMGLPTNDSIHGDHIDVSAPAQSVLTTATGGGDCFYATDAPTSSFATAYVAGAATLLAEAYPSEGPDRWAYRLKASAQRPNPDSSDDQIGWGSIRPTAALNLRPDESTRGPESPFADISQSVVAPRATLIEAKETPAATSSVVVSVAVGLGSVVVLLALLRRLRGRPRD